MISAQEIDEYLTSLAPEDPLLEQAAAEAHAEHLPIVGRAAGRFLETVVLAAGARRVLEIGTANGYSALWLARSLPEDGGLLSIEIDPRRAALARTHLETAGLRDRAHVIVGDAARMVHKVAGPFDVIFNAGDERQYEPLLDRLAALLRPGGVLITGNVLRPDIVVPGLTGAVASYNRRLAADNRFVTSFLPVGGGLAVSVKPR